MYWLESRPLEGGRVVFVRGDADGDRPGVVDLSPEGVNIRSRVHEYGGGACCLVPGHGPGAFAYVDLADQRVWWQSGAGGPPRPLSGEPVDGERWAHGGLGASADGAWVVAVREVHGAEGGSPRRLVVALATGADDVGESILAAGHDFYGAPRLDPLGRRLATVVWDHPDMPWDRSSVEVVPLGTDLVATGQPWLAEGGDDVSVGQPAWRHDGTLRFVSDRHGWWQPHCHSGLPEGPPAAALTRAAAEFHGPDWALGQSTMVELPDGRLVARMTSEGRDSLVLIADPDQPPQPLAQPCVAISALCGHGEGIAYIGAPPDGPANVWALGPLSRPAAPTPAALRPAARADLGPEDVSVGEAFSFVGRSGARGPRAGLPTGVEGDGRAHRAPCRRSWSAATPGPPAPSRPATTPWCSSSPAGASPSPRWTTPAAPATAGSTAARSGGSGASPTPRTASMRLGPWPPRGAWTPPGWPSGGRAPVA